MRTIEATVTVDATTTFIAELDSIADRTGAIIQAVDARYIAGDEHVETACRTARRATEREQAIARDPSVEVLLSLAACRQIEDAMAIGIDEGAGPAVIVVDGGDEDEAAAAVRDLPAVKLTDLEPGLERGDPAMLRDWFDIGDDELAATEATIEELVCERVALLTLDR